MSQPASEPATPGVADGVIQVRLHFGFMDVPDVPGALATMHVPRYEFDPGTVSYFIGR